MPSLRPCPTDLLRHRPSDKVAAWGALPRACWLACVLALLPVSLPGAGIFCLAAPLKLAGRPAPLPPPSVPLDPVTPENRQIVERDLGPQFVYPDTTIWKYAGAHGYVGNGTIICGQLKTIDSARHNRGWQRFFALVRSGKVAQWGFEVDYGFDSLHAIRNMLNEVCPLPPGAKPR